jgi:TatD DNase family protein
MTSTPHLIDSHCHVQNLPPDDQERALDAARERGVRGFLLPCVRFADVDAIVKLCQRHDDVWCALGVHPHEASHWNGDGDTECLRGLLSDPKAVAVGECGLDFYYDHATREEQERCLKDQWHLAMELDLPVVVHNRDSNEEMLEVVESGAFDTLKGVFHSFAGGLDMARRLIPRDFYLGFTGMVTFKAADNVREVLPEVPADRLLVETDTPYLAPVPYRGKRNEPAYVVEIAERVAEELGWTFDALQERTTANFFRLFPKAAG